MATPRSCHQLRSLLLPSTKMPITNGQELDQLEHRVDQQHPRVEPAPRQRLDGRDRWLGGAVVDGSWSDCGEGGVRTRSRGVPGLCFGTTGQVVDQPVGHRLVDAR